MLNKRPKNNEIKFAIKVYVTILALEAGFLLNLFKNLIYIEDSNIKTKNSTTTKKIN